MGIGAILPWRRKYRLPVRGWFMRNNASPGRLVVCLVFLPFAVTPAHAWDFFQKLCPEKKSCFDKYCESTRVVIPGRQVEIVNAQPQVVVRDTPTREVSRHLKFHHAPGVTALPIGTVYMPMALPALAAPPCPSAEANPLESFHRAELAQFQAHVTAEKARAELNATLAAQQRVTARLGTPLTSGGGCDSPTIEKRLTELANQMKEMNDRVTAIEKLLLTHDNIIKDKVLPVGAAPSVTSSTSSGSTQPSTPTRTAVPMIPPLPGGS